jgi:cellulose synthase/poly-beta-1,6-N-acetylglucosamine synthase-like glycosyltransferase/peptidoglycan/xylan/chitin deacetylase (PgdA/CDA1 family)/spore germination protein YaaH
MSGVAAGLLAAFFLVSIFFTPLLPQLHLKSVQAAALPGKPEAGDDPTLKQLAQQAVRERAKREQAEGKKIQKTDTVLLQGPVAPLKLPWPDRPLAIGFYVNWDDSSMASLRHNLSELDWVVPEWIRLSGSEQDPLVLDIDDDALKFIQTEKPETLVLPLLQNYKNEQWNSSILAKAIQSEESRRNVIDSLLATIEEKRFGGITVDLEEVPADSQANLLKFVSEMQAAFHEKGLIVAQAVPFDNPDWDYNAYARVTDYIMLMAYDEHWSAGQPGPVAGQEWFDQVLKKRMADLPAAKTVLCFGNYGYNWTRGGKEAEDVTFQESVLAARESLDSPAEIKYDETTKNPHFSYVEDDGKTHEVWFLDAVTAYNELQSAKGYGLGGYALWRMGSEDPSLWNIFGADKTANSTDALQNIKFGYDVDFEGTGEILQVVAEPQDGSRRFTAGQNGQVAGETYDTLPSSYVMRRTGDQPGKIALTFDDGPDAEWTPRILDILKEKDVKGTFFVIGENGQSNPDLVKRIVAEGNEIGNHSYTHPNLGTVPARVTSLELNATQRLIESLTGRSTRLFRAPYFGDAEPRTPDEVEPTVEAQNLGYISVGLHIDPDDWMLKNEEGIPRTADDIVSETVKGASITTPELRGEIVLLHDGGGDRHLTAEALPRIIDELRAKGYEFTTVSDLAGITRDQAMPPVPRNEHYYTQADSVIFYTLSMGGMAVKWLFILGIVFGLGRVGFISILAFAQYWRSARREELNFGADYRPFVSVVVPAYNEEKVIGRTIDSLLRSDYPSFEIIVVDDGSTDGTYETAVLHSAGRDNITVYRKENGGKAEALNFGWHRAKGEVIVALDADTVFKRQTIGALAARFADEKTGAVAGNAKVGNRINLVTRWQALEYVTSQNLDRRAFSSLNCITVVPGSVGAWRREVLEMLGGFSSGTLAEDQDLTIRVRKLGYDIGYEEKAVGLTEAPDTLRDLAKQRFRWSFGTLQCMWKHKNALFNPKYGTLGFIAMPNVWIFQVLFPLVSPLMDLLFIWTFISASIGYMQHQREYSPTNIFAVAIFYALFLAVDLFGAYIAFLFEKTEQKRLLLGLLVQRFGYRQIMYFVMVKSVLRAISGAVTGWGKLERKATVAAEV